MNIRGDRIKYPESYYVCDRQREDEREYVPGWLMDANLQNARNAYRRIHGLLTSDEIVEIRKQYGVTQRELADMLGWGGATVARYETKQIQDNAQDGILRLIRDDAHAAESYLERNKDRFDETRYNQVLSNIRRHDPTAYFYQMALNSIYSSLKGEHDLTGGAELNLQKACAIASFYASSVVLYKVKLMKLMWYSDALSYRIFGHSITGLAYQHKPMGALPLGHNTLMLLLKFIEEREDDGEGTSYRILPDPFYRDFAFTPDERKVLLRVLEKLGNYTGKKLSGIMHTEEAYRLTQDNEYIPFSLAKKVDI
jgi:putative zinc finger/helix-turn-helix YgiT family protein